jgi:hypothetical protein
VKSGLRIEVITRAQERAAPDLGLHQRLLLANPLAGGEGDPVRIEARLGDALVGKISIVDGELLLRGERVRILWAAGLRVDEQHRRTSAGLMLLLKLQSLHHTLGVMGVSRMALPLYRKLGWADLSFDRYLLIRHSRPAWKHYLGEGWPARLAERPTDAALVAHRALLRAWTALRERGLRVERIEKLGDEFDPLFQRCARPVSVHRSARWLNWVIGFDAEDPGHRLQLCLVRDRQGRPLGEFIVTARRQVEPVEDGFANFTLGAVKGWVVFDPERIDELGIVLLALRELERFDVDVAKVCVANAAVGSRLRRLGLIRRGKLAFLIKASAHSPLKAPADLQLSSWRVLPGDGDHFFF